MAESKRKLPVGVEKFEEIRLEKFYYVDKTRMLRDLLNNWGKVNLFTRPRRFGKSLNMSMLKTFFSLGCNKALFEGLEIAKEPELCEKYMGKFPVISISLKAVEGADFAGARALMCDIIGTEALRFDYLAESDTLSVAEKEMYSKLINVDPAQEDNFTMSDAVLKRSLRTLSVLLEKHHGKKVIILIDEYDVPLAKANERGYYEQMVLLIRNLFEQALKTNDSLYFSVLTGCLRVSKESIFTGLNNLKVLSIMDVQFDEYFGFSDDEVKDMLDYYGLIEEYDTVKEWYDGYRFGDVDVYCPWDVINYIDKRRANPKLPPRNYWSNTSSNDIVKHLLEKATAVTRNEIERLIAGETVTKVIREELTYKDLYTSIENVWSVLFTTGYLTKRGDFDGERVPLCIPNKEIQNIFMTQIYDWMQKTARDDGAFLNAFCEAFRIGDAEKVQQMFTDFLYRTISVRDTAVRQDFKENFYHGVLLGLLQYKETWYVISNRESGNGYTDIVMEIPEEKLGVVIEIKYAGDGNVEAACRKAMEQIEERAYVEEPRRDGMKTILKCGIACYQKECKVIFEKV